MKDPMSRHNWDELTHVMRNMLQCSKEFLRDFTKRCQEIDNLLIDISTEKEMLNWLPPVREPVIRVDALGDGHFGAPRGYRLHRGTDYIVTPGDPVFMTLKGAKVKRVTRPYADYDELTGVVVVNEHCLNVLYYVTPIEDLIGKGVPQGEVIGYAQDVRVKYGPKMLPHIHSEKYIK